MNIAARNTILIVLAGLAATTPAGLSAAPPEPETPAASAAPTAAYTREAALVGLPVLDARRERIGTVENIVLGREAGAYIIIRMDRGLVPGHRLVALYETRMEEVDDDRAGHALKMKHLRHADLKGFPTFTYAADMQLAASR